MPRPIPEWSKPDHVPVPPRVKLRVAKRADYTCAICGGRAKPGDTDHREPLVFSTPDRPLNRESNLQWLCIPCHKSKTRKDVADKARAAKTQKRMAGVEKPSRWKLNYAKAKARGWKPRWK